MDKYCERCGSYNGEHAPQCDQPLLDAYSARQEHEDTAPHAGCGCKVCCLLNQLADARRENERLRAAFPVPDTQGVQFGTTWLSWDKMVGWNGDDQIARDAFWNDRLICRGLMKWANKAREALAPPPAEPALMSCGHPKSAVIGSEEGTNYCGVCADEAAKQQPAKPERVLAIGFCHLKDAGCEDRVLVCKQANDYIEQHREQYVIVKLVTVEEEADAGVPMGCKCGSKILREITPGRYWCCDCGATYPGRAHNAAAKAKEQPK